MISISKIKKIIVIIKNRKENGRREMENGSNPHSKGVYFSLFIFFLFLVNNEMIRKIKLIMKIKIKNLITLF